MYFDKRIEKMPLNLNLMSCPKCGGKLRENAEGNYSCSFCERVWEKKIDDTFEKILGGVEAAFREQRAADLARLKRALYDAAHKEFISNAELSRLSKDILTHYDDEDFYARFYLSTCEEDRNAFSDFYQGCDLSLRTEDVSDILDYLITGLREEWIPQVSDIIEKAYKNSDTLLYSKYRTKFEQMAQKVNEGIFEPTLHRDVFIMYSGKDMDKVLKMVSVLEGGYGLTCFVAARNLKHGSGSTDRYKDAIHKAIKNCDVYLLISSSNSRSRQCEVYEEILYIMDTFPEKPRVEYLAENYKGYGLENKFKEFFSGLEWCISYEDTAERVSDYCDEIQRNGSYSSKAKTESKDIEEPLFANDPLTSKLIRIKRLRMLNKFEEAIGEYEALMDEYPDDIRPYIGTVASVSKNYTLFNTPEIDLHINVIDSLFGKRAGECADEEYAIYLRKLNITKLGICLNKIKKEKEKAERRFLNDFDIHNGVLEKYKSTSAEVIIPETVSTISFSAFKNRKTFPIKSVYIPSSVETIQYGSFNDCPELESLTVAKDNKRYYSENNCIIERVGKRIIAGCKTSVIPSDGSVIGIAFSAFSGCTSLTEIIIPDSITKIENSAFENCIGLKSIRIPKAVSEIGGNPFAGCKLSQIELDKENRAYYLDENCLIERKSKKLILGNESGIIPDGILIIGEYSFFKNNAITSIRIPEGVTSIEKNAFSSCEELTSVYLPDSVEKLEFSAFGCCYKLNELKLSDSIGTIGENAFYFCRSLENIALPKSIKEIKKNAFYGCYKLKSVTLPYDCEYASTSFPDTCEIIKLSPEEFKGEKKPLAETVKNDEKLTVSETVSSDKETEKTDDSADFEIQNGILLKYKGRGETVQIPNNVTKIGADAFGGSAKITNIIVPDSVTEIEKGAFRGCSSIESITLPFVGSDATGKKNTCFVYIFGADENSEDDVTPPSLKTVTVTSGTRIFENAFCYCKNITKITISNTVTNIEKWAFKFCDKLEKLTIPESVTFIGAEAFYFSGLKEVRVPRSCKYKKLFGSSFPKSCKIIKY